MSEPWYNTRHGHYELDYGSPAHAGDSSMDIVAIAVFGLFVWLLVKGIQSVIGKKPPASPAALLTNDDWGTLVKIKAAESEMKIAKEFLAPPAPPKPDPDIAVFLKK